MALWKLSYEHTIKSGPREGTQEWRPVKETTFDPAVAPTHAEDLSGVPIGNHMAALQAVHQVCFSATYQGEEPTPPAEPEE